MSYFHLSFVGVGEETTLNGNLYYQDKWEVKLGKGKMTLVLLLEVFTTYI